MKGNYKTLSRGGQTYESPNLEVVEIATEGLFCASPDKAGFGYDSDNDLGDI